MTPKETMIEYNRMGLSTIPCVSHSTAGIDALKRPHVASWQIYQREIPDIATIEAWYQSSPDAAIGITCGSASGNLVVVDFENKDGCDAYRKWRKRIRAMVDSGHLSHDDYDVIQSVPAVITPTGGVHMYCRLSEPHSGGKIASRTNGSVMIETRGHGHYLVLHEMVESNKSTSWTYVFYIDRARDGTWILRSKLSGTSVEFRPPVLTPHTGLVVRLEQLKEGE